MKKCASILKAVMLGFISFTLLLIILFESELLIPGFFSGNLKLEFYSLLISEMVTICAVPLALWMFRAKVIKKSLVEGKENALLRWGLCRQLILAVPMLLNAFFYYAFMLPSFGYLGIILFLSMFFIYPSLERCMFEVSE